MWCVQLLQVKIDLILKKDLVGLIVFNSVKSKKKLNQISQGTSSITSYNSRIKKFSDESKAISNLPQCYCNAVQEIKKYKENQKLMQLLMRLNDNYTTIKGNMFTMRRLPSISDASYMKEALKMQVHGFTSNKMCHQSQVDPTRKLNTDY